MWESPQQLLAGVANTANTAAATAINMASTTTGHGCGGVGVSMMNGADAAAGATCTSAATSVPGVYAHAPTGPGPCNR